MSPNARRIAAAWLLILSCGNPAHAQQGDLLEELRSTLRGRLDRSDLWIQGIEVGKHGLAQIEARLGAAERFSPGGLTELQAICFLSRDREMGIVFEADADDPEAVAMMIRVAPREDLGGVAHHCQRSAALNSPITTDGGIAVGMGRDDFLARFLHSPSEHGARYTGFYYFDPVEARPGASGPCQLLSGVRARIVGDRISEFFVYRFYRGRGC